ncbi:MAG: hypothetical protein DKM50_04080 [Candidatus Margulisiibacteriota bacterium]|nr:MAG: hypothetical protein A2X43_01795 [Candidatus Margulisbacteria bacterium GWD2_39_127]OGI05483.1 MAG: hypothetical protein A2X42_00040 [Candidatus Margulisbacteria bacterium GWF2_38_17]OGI08319.1 MAG: hypothetical protein A2X41_00205 [Candidatus Margulisbacteria bacterium GWE2_39_32]PZM82315.1 MAG: hypothetical protein DKM50_04080 [Candidatus Margulisiibacteriota bacterium]HAR62939.1 hypothetical protein [Candidatus Margulisiibacteriota bacterium]
MRKFLFLPHCLRNVGVCKALLDEEGYKCVRCGQCKITEITEDALTQGFIVYIVPGASMVKKIFSTLSVTDEDLIIGVACEAELKDLRKNFISNKFNPKNKIAVVLDKDGCVNTDISLSKISKHLKA